jgi:Periplasmic binding protein
VKHVRWLVVAIAASLALAVTAGPAIGANGAKASTASDVGITPTEIRIGVIADTGSPIAPGLFQGAVDGVKAWADYMNAKENGLAGRKIVIDTYDSKLSADDARNSIITACSKDFATVGTAALFVNNVDDLVGCKDSKGAATGMPDFPVVTTETVHQCSPVSWGINPPIIDCATKDQHPQTYHGSLGATNWYLKKYGKNALHGLFLYPSDLKSAKNTQIPAFTAQQRKGIKQDNTFDVSGRAAQSAYTPFVQAMKDSGATYARSGLNDAGVIALRKEAKIQGVNTVKVWDCSLQCYDKDLVSSANAADMEGQYVWIPFIPFEESSTSPAEQNFIKYIGRDKADGFSLQAYASGLFLRDVINNIVKSGGNDAVTRKAVLEGAAKVTDFTADGMLGHTNVGQHIPSPCYALLQVKGGKFVRVFPTKKGTLNCDPKNIYTIKMDIS